MLSKGFAQCDLMYQSNRHYHSRVFHWQYIHGDYVLSKFINFFMKDGEKGKVVNQFLKSMYFLKKKFGINPVLLLKFSILQHNLSFQVSYKKFGKKVFYFTRFLDYKQQLNFCVKRFVKIVKEVQRRKKLSQWKSLALVVLHHVVSRQSKSGSQFHVDPYQQSLVQTRRQLVLVRRRLKSLEYTQYKLKGIFFRVNSSLDSLLLDLSHLYSWFTRFRQFLFGLQCRKLDIVYQISYLKLKIASLSERRKQAFKRNNFYLKFLRPELNLFTQAVKYKKGVVNIRPFFRYREEVEKNVRLHNFYNPSLRHRKLFFRTSKFGQSHSNE